MRHLFLCLLLCLAACQSPPPAPLVVSTAAALAVSPNGELIAAVNPDSGSITLLTAQPLAVLAEIPVGAAPRTLAFDPQGASVWVAVQGAGQIVRVATQAPFTPTTLPLPNPFAQPAGIVVNGPQAFVSLHALNQIAVIDTAAFTLTAALEVAPFPTGLALHGPALYVTHLHTGQLTRLDTATRKVTWVLTTTADANWAQSVALAPDGGTAYVPQQRSNVANLNLAYNNTLYPIVSVLNTANAQLSPTLALDTLDQPVSLPAAAALSPNGRVLYVANAGSDDVSVIDLQTQQAVAHLSVGAHPRGLAVAPDGARLYVNNTLAGSLSVFDLTTAPPARSGAPLTLTTLPLVPTMLLGKQLFNSAQGALSQDNWLACAACHLDGGADARTWLGFPDGPRNTPTLLSVGGTGPWHWSGDLDELQDVEFTIRRIQGGAGLIADTPHPTLGAANAGRSAALDALTLYVASLAAPTSPYNQPDGTLTPAALHGQQLFHQYGCVACHLPPFYTDQHQHLSSIGDIALERNARGLLMDTPALVAAWATAPYFHDGSAPTLREVLFSSGAHTLGYALTEAEVADLILFIQSLPTRSPALPVAPPPE